MTVGQRIQEIRKARGYSQEAVAHDLGISPTAYAKIERSETDVNISRLEQIAKVLKVKTWAFFSSENPIVIMGDNSGEKANQGYNNYINDFTEERKSYQEHIASLKQQLEEKQRVIDSFLRRN